VSTFKELTSQDVKTSRTFLTQLVDVIQEDVSGSTSRRSYPVFVTGGVGPGVTSSLFQTVYDQNFNVQTANPIFDLTVGLYYSGTTVQTAKTGEDSTGKLLFPSHSMMMREKVDIYKQMAQNLLGDANTYFSAPYNSTASADRIDEAMFVCFRRLFARDSIKRETFAMKFFTQAVMTLKSTGTFPDFSNLDRTTDSGSAIFTDVGSSTNRLNAYGGNVGNIVNSANTSQYAGVMFYDQGIAVFDLATICDANQKMTGTIDAMNAATITGLGTGKQILGSSGSGNLESKFIPDFIVSGSIDNIVNHLGSCRFGSSSFTAAAFQNQTNINSTLFFCRATADEFNYSSNPTYVDSDSRIVVIDEGQEGRQLPFTFITTVGLYDANDNLLAVAKLSRPIEKNPEKDITLRIRLDF
jgi:hypothetical protein